MYGTWDRLKDVRDPDRDADTPRWQNAGGAKIARAQRTNAIRRLTRRMQKPSTRIAPMTPPSLRSGNRLRLLLHDMGAEHLVVDLPRPERRDLVDLADLVETHDAVEAGLLE